MITPELVGYVRAEVGKGRTREEIRTELARDGGWSEADMSEAFRIVIPMQGFAGSTAAINEKVKPSIAPTVSPSMPAPSLSSVSSAPASNSSARKMILIAVIVLVIGGLGFAGWFYRASLMSLFNRGADEVPVVPPPPETTLVPPPIATAPTAAVTVKDCGISAAPDLKKPLSYQNNAVLNCLGDSALRCENARAVLNDPLFPDVFQVIRSGNNCIFELAYAADSALMDATGAKLAGQYISCPLASVKAVDESRQPPVFSAPATSNLSRYASQIYFYGTLGIFVESNLDRTKIQSLGCSGPYIDSVIASYRKMQAQ